MVVDSFKPIAHIMALIEIEVKGQDFFNKQINKRTNKQPRSQKQIHEHDKQKKK